MADHVMPGLARVVPGRGSRLGARVARVLREIVGVHAWDGVRAVTVTVEPGRATWKQRPLRIRVVGIFEELPAPVTMSTLLVDAPAAVELLSLVRPVVFVGPEPRTGSFALVAGIETWTTALGVLQCAPGRIRLRAFLVAPRLVRDADTAAALMLAMAMGTRVPTSCRRIAGVLRPRLNDASGRAIGASVLATVLSVSRQAVWPGPAETRSGRRGGSNRQRTGRGAAVQASDPSRGTGRDGAGH